MLICYIYANNKKLDNGLLIARLSFVSGINSSERSFEGQIKIEGFYIIYFDFYS